MLGAATLAQAVWQPFELHVLNQAEFVSLIDSTFLFTAAIAFDLGVPSRFQSAIAWVMLVVALVVLEGILIDLIKQLRLVIKDKLCGPKKPKTKKDKIAKKLPPLV